LKAKVASCPDGKTNDAIAKAEAKKLASIAKACCGDDGVCGGTCSVQAVGQPCDKDGDCQRCIGGSNNGNACSDDDFCPGGTCSTDGDCLSDDFAPSDVGFLPQCLAVADGGAPIVGEPGETMTGVITCFNTQADVRADCEDAAGIGAPASGLCTAPPPACGIDGGTGSAVVSIATGVNLGSVTLSVGYDNDRINLAGTGTDANGLITPVQFGLFTGNDLEDSVTIAGTDVATGFVTNPLASIDYQTCAGAAAAADFSCVVVAASDTNGVPVTTGVSCSVAP
jgi:hypothetical protein